MTPRFFTLLILLAALLSSCAEQTNTAKFHPGDPFTEYLPASQRFTLTPGSDTAITGKYGTSIVALKNSFIYPDGSPVAGPVELSLSEGQRLSDMVLGNITSPEGGAGTIHIEAHDAQGRDVHFNPEAPLLVEMPATDGDGDMELMRGERAPDGSMQWKDPKPLPKYLRTVPLESLDFLPPGFAEAVDEGMPLFGRGLADRALVDSLYYAVRENPSAYLYRGWTILEIYSYATPCWHPELFGPDSEADSTSTVSHHTASHDASPAPSRYKSCPIDPAQIKALRSPAFKNSFVSTHAFAQRVMALHGTCGYEALELYLSNLDKNLWELDEQVADMLTDTRAKKVFRDFAKEKLTNVKEADAYSKALNKSYQRLFNQNKQELRKAQKQLNKARKGERKQYERAMKQYKKTLWKREVHLMTKHRFTLKDGGWYRPCEKGEVVGVYGKIEAHITNTEDFDLLAVYAVYPDRKALNAFTSEKPGHFHSSIIADPHDEDKIPIMFEEQTLLFAVGYVGKQAFFTKKSIKPNATLQYSLTLEPVSKAFIQNAINEYDNFPRHSEISKDMEYQWKMAKERKRLQGYQEERHLISRLHWLATKHCELCHNEELDIAAAVYDGEALFNANCAACHKLVGNLVGPQLQGLWSKYCSKGEREFLLEFVKNSQELVQQGDARAVALYEEYDGQLMTAFPSLSEPEIKAIFDYADALEMIE